MGGWDLSTCNNVKIITQGRDVHRYPSCTPTPLQFSMLVKERERRASEAGPHPSDTSYWDLVGVQGSPWRVQACSVSAAYHTWLGKASRPQALRDRRLIVKPCDSGLSGKPLFHWDWMPPSTVLPILFCELPAGSYWISHACFFSATLCYSIFLFLSIFHIRGSDSCSCI